MTHRYEKQKFAEGYTHVLGCDEVGRGCLAGPVVAAAVILNPQRKISGIDDSKKLSPEKRGELSAKIYQSCLGFGLGVVEPQVIDEINIHRATLFAMQKAIVNLRKMIELDLNKTFLFVDGPFPIPELEIIQQPVVNGDAKVLSVAAASIIAKVYRDQLMAKFHETFPVYNFAKHKGYATLEHRKNIIQYGLSPLHRLTFCSNFV